MQTKHTLTSLTPDATISQIISADKQAGELLASIGLTLKDHEGETLRSVCQQRQWSEVEVLEWVKKQRESENIESSPDEELPDFEKNLKRWSEYLKKTFIQPNRILLKKLNNDFPRVLKVHGNQYPRLKTMQWYFNTFEETLKLFYRFENEKFYPLAEQLESRKMYKINYGIVSKLKKSLTIIKEDQQRLIELMDVLQEKAQDFEHPAISCSTLRILNKNFENLFTKVRLQFNLESQKIIPLIKGRVSENG